MPVGRGSFVPFMFTSTHPHSTHTPIHAHKWAVVLVGYGGVGRGKYVPKVLSDPLVRHSSLPRLCSHPDPVCCGSCVRPGGQGYGAASGTKGRTELLFHLSRAWPCGCSGQGSSPWPPVGLGPLPDRGSVHTCSVWTDTACLRQAGTRRWPLAKTGAASAGQPVSQRLAWCVCRVCIFSVRVTAF